VNSVGVSRLTHFEINGYRSKRPLQNIARFGRVCVWIVDAEPEFLADKWPKLRLEKRPLFRANRFGSHS
jgi:hypothetical protein